MNSYAIIDAVLGLMAIGMRADAIKAQMDAAKAQGKTDEEVHALLTKMAEDAVAAAKAAVQ